MQNEDIPPDRLGVSESRQNEPIRRVGFLEAQRPPVAAPNSGGAHPSSRDSAAMTWACSSKEGLIQVPDDFDTMGSAEIERLFGE
jgi:hypothetical protein